MTYDHALAERIRRRIGDRPDLTEKQVFGGLAFLIHGRMSVGVAGNELMARVGRNAHGRFVARPGARIMDFTTRPMRGWITVAPEGFASDADLDTWIDQGIASALAVSREQTTPQCTIQGGRCAARRLMPPPDLRRRPGRTKR